MKNGKETSRQASKTVTVLPVIDSCLLTLLEGTVFFKNIFSRFDDGDGKVSLIGVQLGIDLVTVKAKASDNLIISVTRAPFFLSIFHPSVCICCPKWTQLCVAGIWPGDNLNLTLS